jgi:hypothetical protein
MASACGRSYFGSRLRMNQVNVSFSWRCDSTAMVSKTTDDFPDPETPVKTVSRPFRIRRVTSWRLFSRAPVTWMYWCVPVVSWLIPAKLVGIPDSFWRDFLEFSFQ